ncbi:MAG: GNAT family N-acetyltransferase [Alphaproteobacteria bacterium]|nr:GNAT family N-acetyltransferase [Alphaproteobacteria bacterium]
MSSNDWRFNVLLEEPANIGSPAEPGTRCARAHRSEIVLEIVDTWDQFENLRDDWDRLIAAAGAGPQVFQKHSWIWHWWRTFLGPAQRPAIVTGRRYEQLVLVVPLVAESRFGVRTLSFMGDPVSQYSDIVCDREAVSSADVLAGLTLAARAVGADLLDARRVREDGALSALLQGEGARVTDVQIAPAMNFSDIDSLADIDGRFSGRMRRNRRKKRNRLLEAGEVSFRIVGEGAEALEIVERALELKTGWLAHHGIVSKAFADARFGDFWRSVAGVGDHAVGLTASVLELDDQPIAIELGLRHKSVHCAHVGAFDIAFENLSPGTAQMDALFEACIADGIESYDMLAPADSYKQRLADQFVQVRDFVLPLSAKGRACDLLRLTEGRIIAKAAMNGLPPSLRKLVKSALGV